MGCEGNCACSTKASESTSTEKKDCVDCGKEVCVCEAKEEKKEGHGEGCC